jgi:hypothetical protein
MVEILDGLGSGQRVVMHADEQMLAKLPTIDAAENHEPLMGRRLGERPASPDRGRRPPNARSDITRPKPGGGGEAAKAKTGD